MNKIEIRKQRVVKMLSNSEEVANAVNDGKFEGLKLKYDLSKTLSNLKRQINGDLSKEYDDVCVVIYCVSDKIKTPEKECDTVEIVLWENGEVSVSSCWNRVNSFDNLNLITEVDNCYEQMLKEIYAIKHANVEIVIVK